MACHLVVSSPHYRLENTRKVIYLIVSLISLPEDIKFNFKCRFPKKNIRIDFN